MASIADLSVLAQDIYDTSAASASASSRGWTRRDPMNWREGFAAGTYTGGGDTVIAFRGTEDQIEGLLQLYGVSLGPSLDFAAPRLVDAVLRNRTVQERVARTLNSIGTLAPVVSRDQRFASPLVAPRRRRRHWEVTGPTARAPD